MSIHRKPEPESTRNSVDCWQHFRHVADIGVHGIGANPARAFEQAGLALTAIVTDPDVVRADKSVDVQCQAPELDLLLFDFLNAAIFEMVTRKMLFASYWVHIEGGTLRAACAGEPVDSKRHQPAAEPKGATLSELSVRQDQGGGPWHARCVVDV